MINRTWKLLLTVLLCTLAAAPFASAQDASGFMIVREDTAGEMISPADPAAAPVSSGQINPLTGLPVSDPDLLTYPPVFIPLSRYPSAFRPSAGHSSAQWVFEMYVTGEESRPMLMYFGGLPEGAEGSQPRVYPVGSAMFGLESLRRLYRGIIISAPPSKTILDSEIYNLALWYGKSSDPETIMPYQELPLQDLKEIMDNWKAKTTPPDLNNLTYSFSDEAPEGGVPGNSLYVRYAKENQIIWQYDVMTQNYKRSQNSVEFPENITADVDTNNGEQISADNLVVIMVPHTAAVGTEPGSGHFDLNLTYSDKMPALIFRSGNLYQAEWTTENENFEVESNRLRPIRLLNPDGSNFKLKPGRTWVHFVMPENPYYEINEPLGTTLQPGSGYWKLPYISYLSGMPVGGADDMPEYNEFVSTLEK